MEAGEGTPVNLPGDQPFNNLILQLRMLRVYLRVDKGSCPKPASQ